MFKRISYKYASEAGYPEYISRRLLTSFARNCLSFPFALRFLWSASHNVKEGDTCPFAISPHLKPLFPFLITQMRRDLWEICSPGICPSLLPSPTRRPSLPQHFPLALRSICFEPLRALRLESELCTNLFGPLSFFFLFFFFFSTRPTLQFRQACSVQDLLVRLPWGDTCCLKPSAWVWKKKKKHPSLGGREAGRVMGSQRGKEWGREAEIHSHYFIIFIIGLLFFYPELFSQKNGLLVQDTAERLRHTGWSVNAVKIHVKKTSLKVNVCMFCNLCFSWMRLLSVSCPEYCPSQGLSFIGSSRETEMKPKSDFLLSHSGQRKGFTNASTCVHIKGGIYCRGVYLIRVQNYLGAFFFVLSFIEMHLFASQFDPDIIRQWAETCNFVLRRH